MIKEGFFSFPISLVDLLSHLFLPQTLPLLSVQVFPLPSYFSLPWTNSFYGRRYPVGREGFGHDTFSGGTIETVLPFPLPSDRLIETGLKEFPNLLTCNVHMYTHAQRWKETGDRILYEGKSG